MDLPRSRRISQSPLGRRTGFGTPHMIVTDEKRTRVPLLLACVFVVAIVGSLLFSNFLPFNRKSQCETRLCETDSSILSDQSSDDKQNPSTKAEVVRATSGEPDSDTTFGGLLAALSEFEPDTCASRGHHHHKHSRYKPSKELIRRLRQYEVQHRECGGKAKDFDQQKQRQGTQESGVADDDCRYVVWIAYSGLGNRLTTLVSVFLYALLTNRTLLVDRRTDMNKLFCEPISHTSWLAPSEITAEWLRSLNESSPQRFGHGSSDARDDSFGTRFTYIHLTHTSDEKDQVFFCDSGQEQLNVERWLFVKSNIYFVPGLFFVSKFQSDLQDLFPEKEAIFHLLGRYLFHPSDMVWSWITRFHGAYLADHEQQVGIQIRTFNDTPLPNFWEQLQECIRNHNLLPNVVPDPIKTTASKKLQLRDLQTPNKVTSVLVTSLQPYYYEKLRDFYLSGPADDGHYVAIHQPSHEGWQQTDTFNHDLKAWADIYLLSFSDVLITSGWSTFGYSAQALAGIRPWILLRSIDGKIPKPSCVRAKSIEPCFHTPPLLRCQIPYGANPATVLPYVQACEDVSWGIKLIAGPASQE